LTKKWLRERDRDPYYRKAKSKGYRSRAVYKLLQISKRFKLIKEGDVIVDLGAFPGGWIQVASFLVGKEGYVLGIDLKKIHPFTLPNVKTMVGDVTKLEVSEINKLLPRRPDVILSDMSPNISGVWELDHIKQIDLAKKSLEIGVKLLNKGGNLLVKVFQGELFKNFYNDVKSKFSYTKIVKPKATRKRSSEVYIVALNFEFND
jgi:23S rRNA (uridine2552-2'-O)-methyltransferase